MSDYSFTHGNKEMDSQGIAIFMYQSTSPQNAPSIENGLIKTIAQPTLPAIRPLNVDYFAKSVVNCHFSHVDRSFVTCKKCSDGLK